MAGSAYPNIPGTQSVSTYSGTAWDSVFVDILEHVPELIWPQSNWVYARMRRDPQLAGILAAYTLPLRRASWAVDPAGARPEVAQAVADDLGLPVLGQPVSPARRGAVVRWAQFLRLSMLELVFGHMAFAKAFDVTGDRARLLSLAERMPTSIADIRVDGEGQLAGIVQYPRGTERNGPVISKAELVWFAHEREGSAWQGHSLLRAAYAPWLLKHEVQRVHATSIRRFGMGVPNVEAPAGATPQQVAEAQRMASSMRVGDQSGAGLPNGFRLQLTGLTGSVPDALAFLRYCDQQMSRMALTGVLDLGDTPNGSRALGDTMLDLLMLSLQTLAEEVAETVTCDVAADIVALNWGEAETVPRIVAGDVGASHQVTASALMELLKHGAITPDPELEAYVRGEWKIPQRQTPQPVVPELPIKASAGEPVVQSAVPRRKPTLVEAAAKTNFAAVQDTWSSALDRLVNDWAKIGKAQRQQLVDQITTAVDDNNVEALASLAVDSKAGAVKLAAAMHAAADDAAGQMAAEAKAQGVKVGAVKPDTTRLDQVAATTAALAAGGLAASAARKAMQVWQPGADGATVAAAVGDFLAGLTDASLRDSLGGALTAAQNTGRLAVLAEEPAAAMFSSEINDGNVCGPCSSIDGTRFDTVDEAEAAYANGGFVDCEGGSRCRGIIVAVWDDAALPVAASAPGSPIHVHVAAPQIDVHVPPAPTPVAAAVPEPPRPVRRRVERDPEGNITAIIEEPTDA